MAWFGSLLAAAQTQAGGGVVNHDVAVTEAATLASTQEAKQDSAVSVTEAATLASTQTAKQDSNVSVTEAATLASTQDATVSVAPVNHDVSVTEAATLASTQSAQGNYPASVTEPATLASTQTAKQDSNVSVTEPATLASTQTAKQDSNVSVTEPATLASTQDAKQGFIATVTEAATLASTETARQASNVSVTEPATLASTQTAKQDSNVSVTEPATLASTQVAKQDSNVSVTEPATLASTQTAKQDSNVSVTEAATLASTQDALVGGAVNHDVSVTEAATLAESNSVFSVPVILGSTKGTDGANATDHTATYPSGIQAGELIILLMSSNGGVIPSSPSGWRGLSQSNGGVGQRVAYRYANGEEETGNFTFTTSTSEKCSWVVLRCSKNAVLNYHHGTTSAVATVTPPSFRGGNDVKDYTLLHFLSSNLNGVPSSASTGFRVVESQAGDGADGASAWVQVKEYKSSANTTDTASDVTLSATVDSASRMFSLTYGDSETETIRRWHDHQNSGVDLNSAGTILNGVGQSFIGNGSRIKKIGVNMRRSSTVSGTLRVKIYSHSGVYGSGAVPAGAALATADTTINPANFDTARWQYEEFVFNTPFRTEHNTPYFFTVECSDISGGNIRVAKASSTTGLGNPAQSADLVTWDAATNTSDLVYFIQTIKNDSPFIFKSNFERATMPDNNTLLGWEALEQDPRHDGISLSTATAAQALQEIVEFEGKKAFQGTSINWSGSGDVERAQLSINYWHHDQQDNVIHSKMRMKFHPDLEYLQNNFTAGIGTGFSDWFSIWETWLQANIAWDGSTGGSARWNINLLKAAGTNQPFTWKLKGETMQPEIVHFDDIWAATNSSVAVQFDKWFSLDIYYKKGQGTNGRLIVKIKYDGEAEQTLFNVNDSTIYPDHPELAQDRWQPVKVYVSDPIMDWMTAAGKSMSVAYSDFTLYNDNVASADDEIKLGSTQNAVVNKNAAVTEAATIGSTAVAVTNHNVSVTEAATLASTQDATVSVSGVNHNVSVTEAATLASTQDAVVVPLTVPSYTPRGKSLFIPRNSGNSNLAVNKNYLATYSEIRESESVGDLFIDTNESERIVVINPNSDSSNLFITGSGELIELPDPTYRADTTLLTADSTIITADYSL